MARFENPFDISKDGVNPLADGIRFHIRESDLIKQKVKESYKYVQVSGDVSPMKILEYILEKLGYDLGQLTIADEHELLDEIRLYNFDD